MYSMHPSQKLFTSIEQSSSVSKSGVVILLLHNMMSNLVAVLTLPGCSVSVDFSTWCQLTAVRRADENASGQQQIPSTPRKLFHTKASFQWKFPSAPVAYQPTILKHHLQLLQVLCTRNPAFPTDQMIAACTKAILWCALSVNQCA